MGITAAQAKGRIKNLATQSNADPRVLMRIYMMERFLERVSLSPYKDNFVIKGGILVTSMVGVSLRSTMDIDTSMKNQTLSTENALRIANEIAQIPVDDGVTFEIRDVENIMDEMEYPGIRMHIDASFERMITPIKVDISTGDVITPQAVEYGYKLMLEDRRISLMAYNLETILAEKLQTILVRERANTRMRDFYDIYALVEMYNHEINASTFTKAYHATCAKRESLHILSRENEILDIIADDEDLRKLWEKYQRKYSYAASISYSTTMMCARTLISYLYKT